MMEMYLCNMVSKQNKRVFVTFTPKTEVLAKKLCEDYDMTLTELVKMLIAKESSERRGG